MANSDRKIRTKDYALSVIRLFAELPKRTQIMGRQLVRCGTSVGAQYREAKRAKSNADFISKIEGSLQEFEERVLVGIAQRIRICSRREINRRQKRNRRAKRNIHQHRTKHQSEIETSKILIFALDCFYHLSLCLYPLQRALILYRYWTIPSLVF